MATHFTPHPLGQYALLDSGDGEKLERFADVVLRRPDPQALWPRTLGPEAWDAAHLAFVRESDRGGRWECAPGAPKAARGKEPSWLLKHQGARFHVRPTPFKHVGLFPEQATNWALVQGLVDAFGQERPRLLNLFGYSGAASVLAAKAGYEVTHVDASKTAITWAVDNAEASGLGRSAMRVVCEDAVRFARREARRGSRYHVILLDPPHYGRGPKGEVWRLEEHLADLVRTVGELTAERALVVLSTYAIGASPLAFERLLREAGDGLAGGEVVARELALPEADGARWLPAGFCARWSRGIERTGADGSAPRAPEPPQGGGSMGTMP